jgi:hypothetical protein
VLEKVAPFDRLSGKPGKSHCHCRFGTQQSTSFFDERIGQENGVDYMRNFKKVCPTEQVRFENE